LKENSTKLTDAKANSHNLCDMTAISSFYNKIIISMPIFSILYFLLSWAFVFFFAFFLLYNLARKPEKNFSLSVIYYNIR